MARTGFDELRIPYATAVAPTALACEQFDDGRWWVLSAGGRSVRWWPVDADMASGVQSQVSDFGDISSVTVGHAPDGSAMIIARGLQSLCGWDAATGEPIGERVEDRSLIWTLDKSPIVAVDGDGGPVIVAGPLFGALARFDAMTGTAVSSEEVSGRVLAAAETPERCRS